MRICKSGGIHCTHAHSIGATGARSVDRELASTHVRARLCVSERLPELLLASSRDHPLPDGTMLAHAAPSAQRTDTLEPVVLTNIQTRNCSLALLAS